MNNIFFNRNIRFNDQMNKSRAETIIERLVSILEQKGLIINNVSVASYYGLVRMEIYGENNCPISVDDYFSGRRKFRSFREFAAYLEGVNSMYELIGGD